MSSIGPVLLAVAVLAALACIPYLLRHLSARPRIHDRRAGIPGLWLSPGDEPGSARPPAAKPAASTRPEPWPQDTTAFRDVSGVSVGQDRHAYVPVRESKP